MPHPRKNPRRANKGYTLLELSIVVGMTTVLGVISGTVMIRGLQVVGIQNAYADVSDAMRTAALSLSNELALGVLNDIPGNALLKGLKIDPKAADSITFQLPLALDGLKASRSITVRVRNEDVNGNLIMDDDEDTNKNGILDRVLERLEDINGDGLYDQPGETRVLASNIDKVSFQQDPGSRQIHVTVLARSAMRIVGKTRTVEKSHEFTVYVKN